TSPTAVTTTRLRATSALLTSKALYPAERAGGGSSVSAVVDGRRPTHYVRVGAGPPRAANGVVRKAAIVVSAHLPPPVQPMASATACAGGSRRNVRRPIVTNDSPARMQRTPAIQNAIW